MPYNTEKIRHVYMSKFNLKCENQSLFREKTSKNNGDFYWTNRFHWFRTENQLKKHKNVCKNHDSCYVETPKKDNKILKYNHGQKSMKVPFINYSDLEYLLEKI